MSQICMKDVKIGVFFLDLVLRAARVAGLAIDL